MFRGHKSHNTLSTNQCDICIILSWCGFKAHIDKFVKDFFLLEIQTNYDLNCPNMHFYISYSRKRQVTALVDSSTIERAKKVNSRLLLMKIEE